MDTTSFSSSSDDEHDASAETSTLETAGNEDREVDERQRWRRRAAWIFAVLVVALVAVLVTVSLLDRGAGKPVAVVSEDGTRTVVDQEIEDAPDADEVGKQDIETLSGDLVIDSVGLSAPLKEMSVVAGVINPPTLADAYVVRDYAAPGDAKHMAVVAMHSTPWNDDAPGNALIDVGTASSTVAEGDEIQVLGNTYEVSSTLVQEKLSAAESDEIWKDEPGKLLIFTCLQRADGAPSTDNAIIVAQLVEDETGSEG